MYATVFPHTLLCTLLVLYHELKVINYYILEKFSKNAFKIIFKEYCVNSKMWKKASRQSQLRSWCGLSRLWSCRRCHKMHDTACQQPLVTCRSNISSCACGSHDKFCTYFACVRVHHWILCRACCLAYETCSNALWTPRCMPSNAKRECIDPSATYLVYLQTYSVLPLMGSHQRHPILSMLLSLLLLFWSSLLYLFWWTPLLLSLLSVLCVCVCCHVIYIMACHDVGSHPLWRFRFCGWASSWFCACLGSWPPWLEEDSGKPCKHRSVSVSSTAEIHPRALIHTGCIMQHGDDVISEALLHGIMCQQQLRDRAWVCTAMCMVRHLHSTYATLTIQQAAAAAAVGAAWQSCQLYISFDCRVLTKTEQNFYHKTSQHQQSSVLVDHLAQLYNCTLKNEN